MVNNTYLRYILCLLFAGVLFACSDGEVIKPENPGETPDSYYIKTTKWVVLDRYDYVERLGESRDNPLVNFLPDSKMRVDAILYKLTSPDGKEIEASGIIAYPETGNIKGIVLGEHFTITADHEAPTSMMVSFEAALALLGYAVVIPDHIGFGATANLPQTYIHRESSGKASLNMIFAAKEYLKALDRDVADESVTAVGYSQGGYSALAFARMAEEEYSDDIQVKAVYAGGGPYVPDVMFDMMIKSDYAYYPCIVPLTILGFNYADNLNLDMSGLFLEPLLSSYQDWFFSKSYTMGEINTKIGTTTISSFMHPDLFTEEQSEDIQLLYNSFRQNSLIDWVPKAPVVLVHGEEDALVPYVNAERAYEAFSSAGAKVTLMPVKADHHETAMSFYLTVLLAFRE